MALVGAFAVFHGHAHGAEMPVAASGLAYGLGFLLATALLHGAGLALGFGLDKAAGAASHKLARPGGAFIGLSGLAILAGVLCYLFRLLHPVVAAPALSPAKRPGAERE